MDRCRTAVDTSSRVALSAAETERLETVEDVVVAAAAKVVGRQTPDCNTVRFASAAPGISGIVAFVAIGQSFDGKRRDALAWPG